MVSVSTDILLGSCLPNSWIHARVTQAGNMKQLPVIQRNRRLDSGNQVYDTCRRAWYLPHSQGQLYPCG